MVQHSYSRLICQNCKFSPTYERHVRSLKPKLLIQSQMFWDHDKLDNLSRYFRFFENQRDILIGWKREALFKYAETWWTFFDMNIPIVTDGYWENVKDYYKDKIKDIAYLS